MTTREIIDKDFIRESKARNAFAVSALRMLRAALKNAEIEKMKPLEEGDVISVISKEAKKLKDAQEMYAAGKRDDLVEQAKKEIALLEAYLPKQLSDEELIAAIKAKIAESGANSPKDFGKVMGLVMKEVQGKADGSKVSIKIKEELARPPS